MNALAKVLRSPWVSSLIGALALAVMVWFFGPLIGIGTFRPFDSETSLIVAIIVIFVLWFVFNLIRVFRSRAREKKLAAGITEAAADPDATATAEEVALLGERLRDALRQLRKAKLGGRSRHLYELPWYMLIGPPGAGKTTALLNCGLTFPLAETQGGKPLQGVGGTRHCDWWFTDNAVLLDTAGRYSTQDSNEKVDSAAWTGFLKLLKKHRPRQPLNGVLLAISLADLALLDEGERLAHARAMRKRLRELHDHLGVRIPVYVLFTKADTIVGFGEFFDTLGREERDQVWGATLPLDDGSEEGGAVARVPAEYDLLLTRLQEQMLGRLQQETDPLRRRLIFGLPQQMAALRDVALDFLAEIFRPSRLEARPLLRGVYLTSGTQDGTSIDRLMGAMASSFGLQRQAVTAWSGTGRSYFLGRLIRDVVFGEAGLVGRDPKEERRRRWTYRAAYAACALVLIMFITAWAVSYASNSTLVSVATREGERYQEEYAALAKRGPQDVDLPAILPALETVRRIPAGYQDREAETPFAFGFGLSQARKVGNAAVEAYYRALAGLLQPRLLARLEREMQANLDKPDFLYEALKAYLVLGRQGPLNTELVENYFDADFAAGFPGDDQAQVREQLQAHLHALLQRPLTAIPLNDAIVAQVRDILNREPLADYSYNRIMRSKRVRDLPEWTVADKATPGGSRIFVRRSGKSLGADGVPGIFTWAGYHSTLRALLPFVATDISENGWVLGKPDRGLAAAADASKLGRDVLGLYLDDYVRRWDAMIADIAIQPLGDLSGAVDKLSLISAPESPFRNLLRGIDAETQLSRAGATDAVESAATQKAQKVADQAVKIASMQGRGAATRDQNLLLDIVTQGLGGGSSAGGGKPVDPTKRVDEHFQRLHAFVVGDGAAEGKAPPPMETAIAKIGDIYQSLNQTQNAPNPGQVSVSQLAGGGGAGGAAASALAEVAKTAPPEIGAMLKSVAQGGKAVTEGQASQEIANAWSSKVLPLCTEAFNRYPFIAGSRDEVPPADFARLLGPGGLIDTFFNENLKPFVDTSRRPWRMQGGPTLAAGSLAQFENAATIRDSLFGNGGALQVGFSLRQGAISNDLAKAVLDIGGQTIASVHASSELQHFQWPGANGKTLVRVTLTPAAGGQSEVTDFDGPWALLRWLDSAKTEAAGQDKLQLTFSGGGGSASFELTADSVRNVFTLRPLRQFRCPAKL